MTYFDQVKPPQNIINTQNKLNLFVQLLSTVEERALEVVEEKYPFMKDLASSSTIIIDPYVNYSKNDSNVWLELFILAEKNNRDLYSRLFFIRGSGTQLVHNQQWGFIFQPVIGLNGWTSIEQYNQEKQCLNDYKNEIVEMLQELARTQEQNLKDGASNGFR